DALQDDLLRGLRGDAAEAFRRDVLALDVALGHLGPVDVEIVVGDERVLPLAGLLLEPLELLELPLARLVDQPLLDVGRQLDGEDAELAVVVHLDGRVARGARRLLVGGEEGVLERRDECSFLDPLVALDLADRLDDLLAHVTPSSIRLARTISAYGISVSAPSAATTVTLLSWAETISPFNFLPAVRRRTRRPTAPAKCACVRRGRSTPGEETSTEYSRR